MSKAQGGKAALAVSVVVAAAIVTFVHYKQENDIVQMRKGVERDKERARLRDRQLDEEASKKSSA